MNSRFANIKEIECIVWRTPFTSDTVNCVRAPCVQMYIELFFRVEFAFCGELFFMWSFVDGNFKCKRRNHIKIFSNFHCLISMHCAHRCTHQLSRITYGSFVGRAHFDETNRWLHTESCNTVKSSRCIWRDYRAGIQKHI